MPGQFTQLLQSSDIHAMIVRGLDAPPAPWFADLTNKVVSDKDSEQYVWLGSAPVMRPWTGGRKPATMSQNAFRVPNKKFESSIEIPCDWVKRDHTGQITMKVAELTERAGEHRINLLSALMDAADATVCYDGQYFFDTDHSEGESGSQSNVLSLDIGTATAPTAAEMETAILTAIEKMLALKDDRGEICNGSARRFTVMTPLPFLRSLAQALKADVILEGGQARSSNMRAVGSLMGMQIEGVVNPRSAWTTKMAVYRADAAIKPYVWQVEQDLKTSAVAEGSEHEFKFDTWLYGVDASYNVGLNQWRGAMQVLFS